MTLSDKEFFRKNKDFFKKYVLPKCWRWTLYLSLAVKIEAIPKKRRTPR